MSRNATTVLASSTLIICLLFALPLLAARVVPVGVSEPVELEISGKVYRYFPLSAGSPLSFIVEGPAVFEPILRWRFEDGAPDVDVDVVFALDGRTMWHQVFSPAAGAAGYPAEVDWRGGRAVRVPLDIPSGEHTVELTLAAPALGVLDVNPTVRAPDVLPWRLVWRRGLGAAYVSNIFYYPDTDVDDFLDGRHEEKYPVETADDVRIEPSIDLSLVREEPGRRTTELRLSVDPRLVVVNSEKSFVKLGARVKETRTRFGYVLADYYAIPGYHVRYLWDADADPDDPYRSCDYRKHSVRLEVGSDRSLPVDFIARLKYVYTGYNQNFVEYDSDAWTTGLVAIVRPVRGVRVDLGYALRKLTALGYDEVGETNGSSDDSDISYEQDEYGLKVRWDVGRVQNVRTVLTLGARLQVRYYQTSKSVEDDPYHAGREDTYWTFSARSTHQLTEGMALEAFYEHRRRSAESDYIEELGSSKDYTANRVGIRLIFEGERFLD
ncbi:hypothetical protein KAW64_02710 [bacterium]|nr:hypothetical protein [bacterium]